MLVAPSGAGKTVLLINMIRYIYTGCFRRVYIWSPSVDVDITWEPVKDFIQITMKPNDRDKCFFDGFDPSELKRLFKHNNK